MKRGSVLMEAVIAMPVLLLLIFGIIQFAHILTARQMVVYAAFCAARAIMVVPPNEQQVAAQNAAEMALSWINIADTDSNRDQITIPGWGKIWGTASSDVARRVEVNIKQRGDATEVAEVEVNFKFPLMIPAMAVNKIIAVGARSSGLVSGTGDFYRDLNQAAGTPDLIDGWPYIKLTETCVLPMPYSTVRFPSGAFDGVNIRSGGGS